MSYTYQAIFTNPKRNYLGGPNGASASIAVSTIEKEQQFGEVSQLSMRIEYDVLASYNLEETDANPCQLNSTVKVIRSDSKVIFTGYIFERPYLADGANILEVKVRGTEGVLMHALCPDANGNYEWSSSSSYVKLTEVVVKPISAKTLTEFDTFYYPDPKLTMNYIHSGGTSVTACSMMYYSIGKDTLMSNILSNSVKISLASKTYLGVGASNFIRIEDEWIWFDGTNIDSKGVFILLNCQRGALGTTAATHAKGKDVYFKAAKEIAPNVGITFKRAKDTKFTVSLQNFAGQTASPMEGKFIITPEIFVSLGVDYIYYYKGAYAIYDVDKSINTGSTVLYLASVVSSICRGKISFGGAGFAAASVACTNGNIAITRVDYSPDSYSPFAWDTINDMIEATGLEEEYGFWYEHSASKIKMQVLSQKDVTKVSPDISITQPSGVATERNLNDVYSGVMVKYSSQVKMNALNKDWIWRDVSKNGSGDDPYTKGVSFVYPYRWDVHTFGVNGSTLTEKDYDSGEAPVNGVINIINPNGTAIGREGAEWNCNYDDSFDAKGTNTYLLTAPLHYCYGWFGDGYPLTDIDEFEVAVYTRGKGTHRMTVQGTTVDPIQGGVPHRTAADWFDLSPELTNCTDAFQETADETHAPIVYKSTQFPVKKIKGFRILVHECRGFQNDMYFLIESIKMVTSLDKYEYYELVSTASTKAGDLVATKAYGKLRGGVHSNKCAGTAKVGFIDAGIATDNEAANIAYNYLLANVKLYEARSYSYEGELAQLPELGMTMSVTEPTGVYTGILRGFTYSVTSEGVKWDFDVLDYNAANLGG